jgi:hypothetical protein
LLLQNLAFERRVLRQLSKVRSRRLSAQSLGPFGYYPYEVFENLPCDFEVVLVLLPPARLLLLGATFGFKDFCIRPTEGRLASSPSVQLSGGSFACPMQAGKFHI